MLLKCLSRFNGRNREFHFLLQLFQSISQLNVLGITLRKCLEERIRFFEMALLKIDLSQGFCDKTVHASSRKSVTLLRRKPRSFRPWTPSAIAYGVGR
jgi:hypothetical protein